MRISSYDFTLQFCKIFICPSIIYDRKNDLNIINFKRNSLFLATLNKPDQPNMD